MMRNKGFTLIEIAIATVIIGLLIAGVIKGASLIEGAKVSSAITLAQDLSVAVNAFKQQYHLLPGDMAITAATPEIPNVRTECKIGGLYAGNNNGIIEAGLSGAPDESSCVPEVLFLAGLAKVDRDAGVPVFKSYYGKAMVKAVSQSHVTVGFAASITHVVEFENLPCEIVQQIDRKIDDDMLISGKAIANITIVNFVPDPMNANNCAAGSIVPFYAVAL
jgi:prepilin-type N-terminal cleavage/methylation domain-containing protein